MNFQDKYIGIIGLGKSGYWSAKLARSLDYNVFISDININKANINDGHNIVQYDAKPDERPIK